MKYTNSDTTRLTDSQKQGAAELIAAMENHAAELTTIPYETEIWNVVPVHDTPAMSRHDEVITLKDNFNVYHAGIRRVFGDRPHWPWMRTIVPSKDGMEPDVHALVEALKNALDKVTGAQAEDVSFGGLGV